MSAPQPPVPTDGTRPAQPPEKSPGTPSAGTKIPIQIGPYRILQLLGEGGMGLVFLAEQSRPLHRRVALKIIKLGMDTAQVVARFETEREALALMNHPNIARVFDAGATEQGRPYFVMEHVAGVPIHNFCDVQRLTTEERLRLFIPVCRAVHHAHQKGILHRDIKPGNVLVSSQDGEPVPKVIDFGIARAMQRSLTDGTFFTEQGQLVGTPGYMSPEQAEMGPVDLDGRTDVYSLGVLLYELLVGARPFDDGLLRKATPAEIQRIIREVEPAKPSTRFSSLGHDSTGVAEKRRTEPKSLVRMLRGDLDWVVMKCLDKDRSRRYASADALAADILRHLNREPVLAGPPTVSYRLRKLVRRRGGTLAVAAVMFLATSTAAFFFAKSERIAGDAKRQRMAGLYYEAMLESQVRPEAALRKWDELIGMDPAALNPRVQKASLLKRENRFDEAVNEAEAIIGRWPDSVPAHLLLASLFNQRDVERAARHRKLAVAQSPNDRFFAAQALLPGGEKEAIELLSGLLREDGTHFDARWTRAWCYHTIRDYDAMLKDAVVLTEMRPAAATGWNILGTALSRLRRMDEAVAALDRAIELSPDYAPFHVARSDLLVREGKLDRALSDCTRALAIDPSLDLARAQRVWVLTLLRRWDEAESEGQAAVADDPKNAFVWHRLGNLRLRRENYEGALGAINRALEIREDMPPSTWADRAQVHFQLGKFEEALADVDHALELDPGDEVVWNRRGIVLHRLGRPPEAEVAFTRASERNAEYGDPLANRSRVRRELRRLEEALADNNRIAERWPRNPGYLANRGITYLYLGDEKAALADFERVAALAPKESALVHLLIYEILMLRGGETDRDMAQAKLDQAASAAANPWESRLIALFREAAGDEEIVNDAARVKQRYEALYALGSRALIHGRIEEARRWYSACIAEGAVEQAEYELAQMHLDELSSRDLARP